jgi:hypothetical protein
VDASTTLISGSEHVYPHVPARRNKVICAAF